MDFNFTTATCEHEEDSAPSIELSYLNQAGRHSSFGEKNEGAFSVGGRNQKVRLEM